MNTFFNILFNTNDTFDYLDNQLEGKLESNSNLIFIIFGAICGIESFFKEYQYFDEYPIIIVALGIILFAIGFSLIIGRYLITYILYSIGKLFSNNGKVIDIRVIVAYALIPRFLGFPIILFLSLNSKPLIAGSVGYWVLMGFNYLIWLWTLKILIQGLMKFHNYGILKGIINISPFLLLYIIMNIIK